MDDKKTIDVMSSVMPGTNDYNDRMRRRAMEEYNMQAQVRSPRPTKKVNKLKVNLKKLAVMGMVFVSTGVVVVKGSPYVGKLINYAIEMDNKNFEEDNARKNAIVQESLANDLASDPMAQHIFIGADGDITGVEAIQQANEARENEGHQR